MHIRSDFRKWFPRMCQYGFIEGRDYEYMPRVRLQDEGGRTVQRYVKDYRITQDMAKKLCKLHHTAVSAAYHLSEAEEEIASAFSFPDLPTVEQQIRTIEAPIQARYADEIALDPEVVDEILRTGSNRSKGQLRLIYNFMVEKTPEEYTEFVKNEYGTGGKGFEIDGSKYAVWFDDLGLRID